MTDKQLTDEQCYEDLIKYLQNLLICPLKDYTWHPYDNTPIQKRTEQDRPSDEIKLLISYVKFRKDKKLTVPNNVSVDDRCYMQIYHDQRENMQLFQIFKVKDYVKFSWIHFKTDKLSSKRNSQYKQWASISEYQFKEIQEDIEYRMKNE